MLKALIGQRIRSCDCPQANAAGHALPALGCIIRPMSARPYVLLETNYRQLLDRPPNLAVLPWGATEAHGYHLPYGTDYFEGTALAHRAAEIAATRGARTIVLPTIPFGNDEQQLDQVATISITTRTAARCARAVPSK